MQTFSTQHLGRACDPVLIALNSTVPGASPPTHCVTCQYALAGHSGTFACPECGMQYDADTRVWFSRFTPWHFRTKGPARYLLAAWVVATMALVRLSHAATLVLLLAFGGLSILVFAQRTMSRKRHFRPYVATTPQGLVVSRSGRPGQFTVLSWSTVAERLGGGPRPWRWGADLSRDLDVHLEVARSREVFAEVNRRVDTTGSRDGCDA